MSFYTNHALKAVHIIVVLNRTFRYIHGKFCQDRPCFLTCPLHTHHFCMCACENSLDCSTNMNSWQRAYHGGLTAAFQGVFFFHITTPFFLGSPPKRRGVAGGKSLSKSRLRWFEPDMTTCQAASQVSIYAVSVADENWRPVKLANATWWRQMGKQTLCNVRFNRQHIRHLWVTALTLFRDEL